MSTPHPSVDELADFTADVLPRARTRAVADHVSACADCSRVTADLQAVPALLAVLPNPTMPDHVAARLDTVLAAESERRQQLAGATSTTAASGTVGAHEGARVHQLTSPRRAGGRMRRSTARHPRWRSAGLAAATALVVAGGAAVVGPLLAENPAGQDSATAGSADRTERPSTGRAESGDAGDAAQRTSPREPSDAQAATPPQQRASPAPRPQPDSDDFGAFPGPPVQAGTGARVGLSLGMASF